MLRIRFSDNQHLFQMGKEQPMPTTANRTLYQRLAPYKGKPCGVEKNGDWGQIDMNLGTGAWKITDVGPDYITIIDDNGVREFTFPTGMVAFRNLNQ